jgi:hypothetical protein
MEARPFDVRVSAPVGIPTRDVVVDDPLQAGGKLLVTQIIRDDPLARLQRAGYIDEAQYAAGRAMQGFYERAEIGGLKAMDTTKEPVDGGGAYEILTEKIQQATAEIIRLEAALGKEGAALVRSILVAGLFCRQYAKQNDLQSERAQRYIATRFRECLDTLAKELNYA